MALWSDCLFPFVQTRPWKTSSSCRSPSWTPKRPTRALALYVRKVFRWFFLSPPSVGQTFDPVPTFCAQTWQRFSNDTRYLATRNGTPTPSFDPAATLRLVQLVSMLRSCHILGLFPPPRLDANRPLDLERGQASPCDCYCTDVLLEGCGETPSLCAFPRLSTSPSASLTLFNSRCQAWHPHKPCLALCSGNSQVYFWTEGGISSIKVPTTGPFHCTAAHPRLWLPACLPFSRHPASRAASPHPAPLPATPSAHQHFEHRLVARRLCPAAP